MIMKVAVPLLKHSPRLGQEASSHTDASLCLRSLSLISLIFGEAGIFTRIQSGFLSRSTVGMTLTGMRATFSAPLSFLPSINTLRLGCSDMMNREPVVRACGVTLLNYVVELRLRQGLQRAAFESMGPGVQCHSCGWIAQLGAEGLNQVLRRRLQQVTACPLSGQGRMRQIAQLGDRHALVATGIDAGERGKVHIHVETETVIRPALAYAQAECSNFSIFPIDAGSLSLIARLNT